MTTGGEVNRPLAVLVAVGYVFMIVLIISGIATRHRARLAKQQRKGRWARFRRR